MKINICSKYCAVVKGLLFIGFGFIFHLNIYGQGRAVDSLIALSKQDNISDSIRLLALEGIAKDQTLNPELRLKYTDKMFEIASRKNDPVWLFNATLRYGHAYTKTGQLDDALENYFEAGKYANALKDKMKEAIVYSNIGGVYAAIDDLDKSLFFYKKGIRLLREENGIKSLAGSLNNIAKIYKFKGDYDSAMLCFKEAGRIYDSLNFKLGKAYNIGNTGLLLAEMNQDEKALENIGQAISILTELGDYYAIADYNLSMASFYAKAGKVDLALNFCKHSLKIAKEYGLKEQIKDAHLKISEIYKSNNEFEKAYSHLNQYLIYRDSINNEAVIRKMADLRTEYEVAQKQIEVDYLEEQQKQQNMIFLGLLIIILMLAFLVFLYYRIYKRKQTLNLIITERKEEVEAQRDQLVAMNETKEKFLSIVSHDLLGPVNSFKGLSTIMKASIDANDTKDLEYIHKLFDSSVNNLSALLSNLLDWSITQKGAIPYNPERLILFNLVNELLDLFFNMARAKDIILRSTVADDVVIWADINSVKTILRNLVSNSIKFTNAGGEIVISAYRSNDMYAIQVADNGIGMDRDRIDNLLDFDNYTRSAGTKGEGGIGLGLQLVKEFAEMNRGSIAIESQVRVGTKITVFLPISEFE